MLYLNVPTIRVFSLKDVAFMKDSGKKTAPRTRIYTILTFSLLEYFL